MPTYTLATPVSVELEIRKSRFLGSVQPVADRAAAMTLIDAMRAAHPTATHVCWALLAGGQSGMSDDGEPGGTAGRPMLEVLRHQHVDGVLAMVVRYYGGVKLGAGGLVRAYTDAIAKPMQQATLVERIAQATLIIKADYADEARIRHWLGQNSASLIAADHAERVTLTIQLPQRERTAATEALRDLTQGRAVIQHDEAF
ncbi:putative YigZ family protein [Silvimonas terrae]|uniref:Putative YigZ family protein n=1 Tax=Silvimonas terrae TaxID=300266 RepID=A0A840RLN7_9NEIS|nr:YigZ family protein [Silvimonas terrae]MBB5193093.1 putative YigZ family protein [Silvimonas terrae]